MPKQKSLQHPLKIYVANVHLSKLLNSFGLTATKHWSSKMLFRSC